MAMEETARVSAKLHSLRHEEREKLLLAGVEYVTSFDENLIVLTTSWGELTIRGQQLHIERIELESGVLEDGGLLGLWELTASFLGFLLYLHALNPLFCLSSR